MSRRHVLPLLSDYIDGTLPPAAVRQVEAHLACCSECAQELARWRTMLRLVSHHAPMTCPVDCAELVIRTIEARRTARLIGDGMTVGERASQRWSHLARAFRRPRLAATALAVLILALGGVSHRLASGLHRTFTAGQWTAARDPGHRVLELWTPSTTNRRLAAPVPAAYAAVPVRAHAPDRLQEAFGRSDSLILAADFVEEDR